MGERKQRQCNVYDKICYYCGRIRDDWGNGQVELGERKRRRERREREEGEKRKGKQRKGKEQEGKGKEKWEVSK